MATLVSLHLLSLPLLTGSPPARGFEGAWVLDAQASQPIDGILKELGYGWVTRKVFATLSVEQFIQTKPAYLKSRIETLFGKHSVELYADRVWRPGRKVKGGTTRRRTHEVRPGHWVTEDRFPSGKILKVHRVLVGNNRFEERLELTKTNKVTLRGTRVFRRQ
ncbi:MAG TPA: hypothetical protein DEB46_14205 [Myxococcales bacterium]|nr:hypothetical protein [Myxococcales bacterium]